MFGDGAALNGAATTPAAARSGRSQSQQMGTGNVTAVKGWASPGLPILEAGPRARHAESEVGCTGKHVARVLTGCVPIGTAHITPWR
jgi:hypothetical protein